MVIGALQQKINELVNDYIGSDGVFSPIDPELKALMLVLQANVNELSNTDRPEMIASYVMDTLIQLQQNRVKSGKPPGRFETVLLNIVTFKNLDSDTAFLYEPIQAYLQETINSKSHNLQYLEGITPFESDVIRMFFKTFTPEFPTNNILLKANMMQAIQNILYATSFFEFEDNFNALIQCTQDKLKSENKGLVTSLLDRFKVFKEKENSKFTALKALLETCRSMSYKAKQESLELQRVFDNIDLEGGRPSIVPPAVARFTTIRRDEGQPSIITPPEGRLTIVDDSEISTELTAAVNSLPHNIHKAISGFTGHPNDAEKHQILENIRRHLKSGFSIDEDHIEDITRFVLEYGEPTLQEAFTDGLGTLLSKQSSLTLVASRQGSFFVEASRADALQKMIEESPGGTQTTLVKLLQELSIINAKSLALAKIFVEKKENTFTSPSKLKEFYNVSDKKLKQLDDRKNKLIKDAFEVLAYKDIYLFTRACDGAQFVNYDSEIMDQLNRSDIKTSLLKEIIAHYKTHLDKIADGYDSLLIQPLNELFIGLLEYVVNEHGLGRTDSLRGLLSVIKHFLSTNDILDTKKFSALREKITLKMFDIEADCKAKGLDPNRSRVYNLLHNQLAKLIQAEIETDGDRLVNYSVNAKVEDFTNLFIKIESINALVLRGVEVSHTCQEYLNQLPDLILEKIDLKIRYILTKTNPIEMADAIQKVINDIGRFERKGVIFSDDRLKRRLSEIKEELTEISTGEPLREKIRAHVQDLQQEPIEARARVFNKNLDDYQGRMSKRTFGANSSRQDSLYKLRILLKSPINAYNLRQGITEQLQEIETEYKGWWSPKSSELYRLLTDMLNELDIISVRSLGAPLYELKGNHPFIEEQISTLSNSMVLFSNDTVRSVKAKEALLAEMDYVLRTVFDELSQNKALSFTWTSILGVLKTLSQIEGDQSKNIINGFLDKVKEFLGKNSLEEIFNQALNSPSPEDLLRVKILASLDKALLARKGGFLTEDFLNNKLPAINPKESAIDKLIASAHNDLINKFLRSAITFEEADQVAASLAIFSDIAGKAQLNFSQILDTGLPMRFVFRVLEVLTTIPDHVSEEHRADIQKDLETFKEQLRTDVIDPIDLSHFLTYMTNELADIVNASQLAQIRFFKDRLADFPQGEGVTSSGYVLNLLDRLERLQSESSQDNDQIKWFLREVFSELKVLILCSKVDDVLMNKMRGMLANKSIQENLALLLNHDDELKAVMKSIVALKPSREFEVGLVVMVKDVVGTYESQDNHNKALAAFATQFIVALRPLKTSNEAIKEGDQSKPENKAKDTIESDFRIAIGDAMKNMQQSPEPSIFPRLIVHLENMRDQLVAELTRLRKPDQNFIQLLDTAVLDIVSAAEDYHVNVFRDDFRAQLALQRENVAAGFNALVLEPAVPTTDAGERVRLIDGLRDMLRTFDDYTPSGRNQGAKSAAVKGFNDAIILAIDQLKTPGADVTQVTLALVATLDSLKPTLEGQLKSESSLPERLGQVVQAVKNKVEEYFVPVRVMEPVGMLVPDGQEDVGDRHRILSDSTQPPEFKFKSFDSVVTEDLSEAIVVVPVLVGEEPQYSSNPERSRSTDTVDLMAVPSAEVEHERPLVELDLSSLQKVSFDSSAKHQACRVLSAGLDELLKPFKDYKSSFGSYNQTEKATAVKGVVDAIVLAKNQLAVESPAPNVAEIRAALLSTLGDLKDTLKSQLTSKSTVPDQIAVAITQVNALGRAYYQALVDAKAPSLGVYVPMSSTSANVNTHALSSGKGGPSAIVDPLAKPPRVLDVSAVVSGVVNAFRSISGPSLQRAMARVGAALCIGSLLHKVVGVAVIYLSTAMLPFVGNALRLLRSAYALE